MKHNAPDFTKITDAAKKNAELLTSTTQVATESAYALLRRGSEIMQNHITSSFDAMKDITAASDPKQAVARQQEFIKSAVECSVSNTKEMFDLAAKSTMEVLASVGTQFSDNLNESLCSMNLHCTKK